MSRISNCVCLENFCLFATTVAIPRPLSTLHPQRRAFAGKVHPKQYRHMAVPVALLRRYSKPRSKPYDRTPPCRSSPDNKPKSTALAAEPKQNPAWPSRGDGAHLYNAIPRARPRLCAVIDYMGNDEAICQAARAAMAAHGTKIGPK